LIGRPITYRSPSASERARYIAALQAADRHDIAPLLAFTHS
jgi:hypothetical protein